MTRTTQRVPAVHGPWLARRWFGIGAIASLFFARWAKSRELPDWAVTRPPTPADRSAIAAFRAGAKPWSFHLDFSDGPAFAENFIALEDDEAKLKSCRRVENAVLEDGQLALKTSAVATCHVPWATGSVKTRTFRQRYGFFEARLQTAAVSGINNAFWLWGAQPGTGEPLFEIDIVEAHYPRRAIFTVHDWRPPHRAKSVRVELPFLPFESEHDYAVLWRETEMVFAIDGVPYAVIGTMLADGEADMRFSTAITEYAGPTGTNLAGSAMRVRWVRVASA